MMGSFRENKAAGLPDWNQTYLHVRSYFKDSVVLLTGASGFVGAVILEQLLRLTDVQRVYVLTRPKAGSDPSERVRQLLSSSLFQLVQSPVLLSKVHAVPGDITQPKLGIADALISKFASEVDTIIHSAANISFAPHIHKVLRENYLATESLLQIATACKQLRSFVFLSSAYANGNQPDGARIMEQLYNIPCASNEAPDPCEVVKEWLSLPPDTAAAVAKAQLDQWGWPNNYTFSKFAAEHLVMRNKRQHHLPVAILRPTYIGPTAYKPIPGYCGNMAAGMAITATVLMGLFSSTDGFALPPHLALDHIPADVVGHACLAAAALAAFEFESNRQRQTQETHTSSTVKVSHATEAAKAAQHAGFEAHPESSGQHESTQPTTHDKQAERQMILHVCSSDLNEISWADWYGSIYDYVQNHPRPVYVEPHLPPKFSTTGYVPNDGKRAVHDAQMAEKVSTKCDSLRMQGRVQEAKTVQHVWKMYNVLNSPKLSNQYTFDNTNAQWAERLLSPEDKHDLQLTWRSGIDLSWKEYIDHLIQGIVKQAVLNASRTRESRWCVHRSNYSTESKATRTAIVRNNKRYEVCNIA